MSASSSVSWAEIVEDLGEAFHSSSPSLPATSSPLTHHMYPFVTPMFIAPPLQPLSQPDHVHPSPASTFTASIHNSPQPDHVPEHDDPFTDHLSPPSSHERANFYLWPPPFLSYADHRNPQSPLGRFFPQSSHMPPSSNGSMESWLGAASRTPTPQHSPQHSSQPSSNYSPSINDDPFIDHKPPTSHHDPPAHTHKPPSSKPYSLPTPPFLPYSYQERLYYYYPQHSPSDSPLYYHYASKSITSCMNVTGPQPDAFPEVTFPDFYLPKTTPPSSWLVLTPPLPEHSSSNLLAFIAFSDFALPPLDFAIPAPSADLPLVSTPPPFIAPPPPSDIYYGFGLRVALRAVTYVIPDRVLCSVFSLR